MRTVTFSDASVAKAVNDSCVATWVNRVTGFHNCQFGTEEWILKSSPECFATKNFCTYFCTPDKKVLHYFTGYFAPKPFLRELAFARRLMEKAVDESGAIKADLFKEMHAERLSERRLQWTLTEEAAEEDIAGQFAEASRKEGLEYLTKVDRALQESGPPLLGEALKRHLYGNEFSEEKSDRLKTKSRRGK